MRNVHHKPEGTPDVRGQPKRRRLPVQADPRPDATLAANEHHLLARAAPQTNAAGRLRLIAGMPQGDCFVVVNCRGECWDGERWVEGWGQGVQFRRPDPAYELCEMAAKEAEMVTGVAGSVCYIPPGMPSHTLAPFPDLSQVDLRDFALKPEVC